MPFPGRAAGGTRREIDNLEILSYQPQRFEPFKQRLLLLLLIKHLAGCYQRPLISRSYVYAHQ